MSKFRGESGFILPPGVPHRQKWVCVWETDQGAIIANEDKEYLCAESWTKDDPKVEAKMRAAVRSFGIEGGKPLWMPGRKVTKDEYEEQLQRMRLGLVPDPQEEPYVELEDAWLRRLSGSN